MSTVTPPTRHLEIGQKIRAARIRKGMRQVDLAAAARLSWRHLIRMERGEGGEPKRETLDRVAEALGVDRSALVDEDDEEAARMGLSRGHRDLLAALAVALEPFKSREAQA